MPKNDPAKNHHNQHALHKVIKRCVLTLLLAGIYSGYPLQAASQPASSNYEDSPLIEAAEILPANLLQSAHHRVRNEVRLVDDFFQFEIESDVGFYTATSLALLEIRIHEIDVLAKGWNALAKNEGPIRDLSRGQFEVHGDSIVDIVTSPIDTATQLATELASNVQAASHLAAEIASDPRSALSSDQTRKHKAKSAAVIPAGDEIQGLQIRSVASQLNLDVYSSNRNIQAFLNKAARAKTNGKFAPVLGAMSVGYSDKIVVVGGVVDADVKSRLKNLMPLELIAYVDAKLAAVGVSDVKRREFLEHPVLSLRHKTTIVVYLDFLSGIDRRETLVDAALTASNEADSLAFEQLVRMLAHYDSKVSPIRELQFQSGVVVAKTKTGGRVIFYPVDIAYWKNTMPVCGPGHRLHPAQQAWLIPHQSSCSPRLIALPLGRAPYGSSLYPG